MGFTANLSKPAAAVASKAAVAISPAPKAQSAKPGVREFKASIAGSYRSGAARGQWALGDVFELRAEPDNQYDKNAIALFKDGERVGYIARVDAAQIIGARALGYRFNAKAVLASKENGVWDEGFLMVQARLASQPSIPGVSRGPAAQVAQVVEQAVAVVAAQIEAQTAPAKEAEPAQEVEVADGSKMTSAQKDAALYELREGAKAQARRIQAMEQRMDEMMAMLETQAEKLAELRMKEARRSRLAESGEVWGE